MTPDEDRSELSAALPLLVKQQASVGLLVKRFLAGDKETLDLLIAKHGTRDLAASALMAMHQQAAFDVRTVRQSLGLDRLVHAVAKLDDVACGKALEECNASAQWSKVGCRACWDSGNRPQLGKLGPAGRGEWTGELEDFEPADVPRAVRRTNYARKAKDRKARKAAKKAKRKGRR